MDLTRGEAGRHPPTGHRPGSSATTCPPPATHPPAPEETSRHGSTRDRRPQPGRARHRHRHPRLGERQRAAGGARSRTRGRLPGRADRDDEAARRLRPGHPRALRRRRGLHRLLRTGHRGTGPGMDEPGRGDGRAQRGRPPDHHVRHGRAERHLAAADGHRPGTGRHGADRAGRRLRPAGHPDQGDAGRGRLPARRREDLDHQRAGGRHDRRAVQDRPGRGARQPRHQRPARRRRGPASPSPATCPSSATRASRPASSSSTATSARPMRCSAGRRAPGSPR